MIQLENYIEDEYCTTLRALARVVSYRGVILELGMGTGAGSLYLCEGALESRCEVYGVDTFIDPSILPAHLEELKNRRLYQRILAMSTVDAAAIWNYPISLLFVDTANNYHSRFDDFNRFYKHVIPGGVIVIHDTEEEWGDKLIENVSPFLENLIKCVDSRDNKGFIVALKPEKEETA